jgi:tRNA modification GTPase
MGNITDTIVAIATPAGEGALGIIRLSGPDTIRIGEIIFHGRNLAKQASHTAHFGLIKDEKNEILDEVVLTLFRSPRSFTTEDIIELTCHGSSYNLQSIVELCVRHGARLAGPGEFTQRAFLNGRIDLAQAEAVADLIAAENKRSHDLAVHQMRGGFSKVIEDMRSKLIDFASLLELELDFGEEDVEFADRTQLRTLLDNITESIDKLIRSFQLGNVIKNGVNTVIAGKPNAGKSTLLNTLLNEERAIVSDIPGTTRDTIEEVINIEGIQFRLIDTAGLREARDQIEAIGVERTMEKIRHSSVLIYVFDVTTQKPSEVLGEIEKLQTSGIPILVIANKIDLIEDESFFNGPNWLQLINTWRTVLISAKDAGQVEKVKEALYHQAIQFDLKQTETILSNVRHYDALQTAQNHLNIARKGMDDQQSSDLITIDIRHALHAMGSITGTISTDDLLGNIFGKFCIGK